MKRLFALLAVLTATVPVALAQTPAQSPPAAGHSHWGYEGEEGPGSWGQLSSDFSACAAGRSQSPIDIGQTISVPIPALKTAFRPAALRIVHHEHVEDAVNNGHTIQVNSTEDDTLAVGGARFKLLQYHFHDPSEHTVGGQRYPMEMHLVFRSEAGTLAVIGVLMEEGAHNAAFDPVWSNLPRAKGVESHLEHVKVGLDDLLPRTRTAYRYDGSLTTPPCSEGVKWFVMTTPIALSPEQIAAFTALVKENNRPVQPLNGRAIVTDRIRETTP